MADLLNVPGGGELWAVEGKGGGVTYYLMYEVPGTDPPVPMVWEVKGSKNLKALFGPGKEVTPDRTISRKQFRKTGYLRMGVREELVNESEHPFRVFLENYEREAEIRPWLRDAEVLALHAAAILEGRTVTEAELKTTDWWQSHTEGERKWMALIEGDPKTGRELMRDNRLSIRQALVQAGLSDPNRELVRYIADRMTTGQWSREYTFAQVAKVADPYAPHSLDRGLRKILRGGDFQRSRDQENEVRNLVAEWLGPRHMWTEQKIAKWAGKLRNDPNAQEELVGKLQRQRVALFPEYTDPQLTYEDISAPWASLWAQVWGEVADEKSGLFHRIVRMNDSTQAEKLLMKEGYRRGNQQVKRDLLTALDSAFSGQGLVRAA